VHCVDETRGKFGLAVRFDPAGWSNSSALSTAANNKSTQSKFAVSSRDSGGRNAKLSG